MKAIKTFFSLAILFVFVYLITLALFAVDVFLNQDFYGRQVYLGTSLYLEVLLYSFPVSFVVACLLSLSTLIKSHSLSGVIFLGTAFAIALLGFGGIHYFASDVIAEESTGGDFPYDKPFTLYQEGSSFLLFRAVQSALLKDIIAIDVEEPLGAAGFYTEGVWNGQEQALKLLPASRRDASRVIERASLMPFRAEYKGSHLRIFLSDVYYLSFFLIQLPFTAFVLNLVGLIIFLFSLGQFVSFFSRIMAALAIVWIVRLIFFSYRFFAFDVVYIVRDFGLFPSEFLLYLPLIFCTLASFSLMGLWQLLSARNK